MFELLANRIAYFVCRAAVFGKVAGCKSFFRVVAADFASFSCSGLILVLFIVRRALAYVPGSRPFFYCLQAKSTRVLGLMVGA